MSAAITNVSEPEPGAASKKCCAKKRRAIAHKAIARHKFPAVL